MTTQTLRPNATLVAGGFSAVPSGTLNAVTSDNSDSTYALSNVTLNNPMFLGLGTYALATTERVKVFQVRQRFASSTAGVVAGEVLVSGGGLGLLQTFNPTSTTAPVDGSTGWRTPTSEVTVAAISDATLRVAQTFTDSTSALRVIELYLDLDVRARPTISSVVPTLTLGIPTYVTTFTYNTSGKFEAVSVSFVVTNLDTGAIVDTATVLATGTDFAGATATYITLDVLPNGSYQVDSTVIAGGFVAPDTTFISAQASSVFSVTPAGVEGPDLSCLTNQDAQTVTLEITQPDSGTLPVTNCLVMESFDLDQFTNAVSLNGSTQYVTTTDKAALRLTGDITITGWFRMTDWTPTAIQRLVSKTAGLAASGGYELYVATSGLLTFQISTGAALRTMVSTAPTLTDGTGYWLEVFYNDTTKTTRFRKSSDPPSTDPTSVSWTTINTTAAHAGGSPAANTSVLAIGASSTGTSPALARIGVVNVYGTGAALVASADFRMQHPGSVAFADGLGNTWTYTASAAVIEATQQVTTIGNPRHVDVWIGGVQVTPTINFGGNLVTVNGDASATPGTVRLVVATVGGSADTNLVAYQISGPGNIVHNFTTSNLIVQARDATTGLQADVGVQMVDSNTLAITGPFSQLISVLILAEVGGGAYCVPTLTDSVLAATQDQVFVHQFASQRTLVTTAVSGSTIAWLGVQLNPGNIVVDNDGPACILYMSGALATFDDPDAVRAEVQRDGELIPLDGMNGALVPPPDEGALIVVDRFPVRFSAQDCGLAQPLYDEVGNPLLDENGTPLYDDSFAYGPSDNPDRPVYRVRFYGYVDGILSFSPWVECQPDAVLHNGKALLRSPMDGDLDQMPCVSDEPFTRVRPMSATQPATGGKPYTRSGIWGGRNYSLVFEAQTTADALAVEAVLAETYFWYGPLDPGLPAAWLAPDPSTSFQSAKVAGRPYTIQQSTVEIDPEPVLLPPAGPTLS